MVQKIWPTGKRTIIFWLGGALLVLLSMCTCFYLATRKTEVFAKPTGTIVLEEGTAEEFIVPEDAASLVEEELLEASPAYDAYVQTDQYSPILIRAWGHAVGFNPGTSVAMDSVGIISKENPLFYYAPYHSGKEGAVFDIDSETGAINWLYGLVSRQEVPSNQLASLSTADSSDLKSVVTPDGGVALLDIVSGRNRFTYMDSAGVFQTNVMVTFPQSAYALFMFKGLPSANARTYGFGSAAYSIYPVNLNGTLGTITSVQGVSAYAQQLRTFFGGGINREFIDIKNVKQMDDGSMIGELSLGDESNWSVKGTSLIVSWNDAGQLTSFPDLSKEVIKTTTKIITSSIVPNSITFCYRENSQKSEVIKITGTDTEHYEQMQQFPAGTNLQIVATGETGNRSYTYAGVVKNPTGPFLGYEAGYVTGYMDEEFNIVSVRNMQGNVSGVSTHFMYADGTKVYTSGTIQGNTEFVDAPVNGWGNGKRGFYNKYVPVDDYAPAIHAKDNLQVNLSDYQAATSEEQNHLLLTGNKAGTGAYGIEVFDTVDSNDADRGQSWLEDRINRNPNQPSAPIDWEALGFDQDKTGPQLVSYFITDSQKQATTTSRWLNKVTNQTIIEDAYDLDAQNFAIALNDVAAEIPNEDAFKRWAKTMAWNTESHVVDEDGAAGDVDAKVTIDSTQLAVLQGATVAKPYPVDVTYDPKGDGSLLLTNRVWVFVTTKNTEVDTQNGIVIYADDYELTIQLAQTETKQQVYEHANVKVYDYYDADHEQTVVLPVIADNNMTTGLDIANMPVINDATEAGVVQPAIVYTSGTGTTTAMPDVTIIATILLHVRQVVYAESPSDLEELVIPNHGYLQLINTGTATMNQVVPSGEAADNPAYVDFSIEIDNEHGNNELVFQVIEPEYYEYRGYTVTNSASNHSPTALSGTDMYHYDFANEVYEQWVTVYIQPKLGEGSSPKQYSWSYKSNDLGTISP